MHGGLCGSPFRGVTKPGRVRRKGVSYRGSESGKDNAQKRLSRSRVNDKLKRTFAPQRPDVRVGGVTSAGVGACPHVEAVLVVGLEARDASS